MSDTLIKINNDHVVMIVQDRNAQGGIREKGESGESMQKRMGTHGFPNVNSKCAQLMQFARRNDS